LNVLDLFSGIGGFSLGLERAGMRTVAFCEIEPYARAVLRKHWPNVPCYDDVRTLTADRLNSDGIVPDVICGGFPCQDISYAGNGAGIEGARSGLWSEYARLIGELRPKFVAMENVTALLNRGLGNVLRDLAEIGYDAEWHCIPASAVGAPHRRDRWWLVGYPQRVNDPGQIIASIPHQSWPEARLGELVRISSPAFRDEAISALGGMDDGLPDELDRLRCLGNAVVPQIPEIIGRAIMKHELALQASNASGSP
jgi:DNA (cytosine-5)-methyltransferase 1